MTESGALRPGDVVAGKYRVEALLGRGGMGVVYVARQLPMERAVALKVLRAELLGDPRARARFEREARIASALSHPSAVAIHDFGQHHGVAYLAMELVEGVGLRAAIADMTTARAIDLATQLADVLAAAHGAGLVHRDLTPENVMLERHGDAERARVLDFGLAFAAGGAPGPASRMTREGVVVGTPEYLSPEQARGEEVGPPTDVYALGCVLHELLAGRAPFTGTEMDVLTKQMFAPAPPLRRPEGALRDVPVALDDLRRAMLDKRADARPSAAEVRDRLAALDPDPERARARARVDGYLGPRAARMVDAPVASTSAATEELEVAVVGSLDASLALALRANAIHAFRASADEPLDAAAVFLPDATEAEVARLRRDGRPLIAGIDRADAGALSALLRAGAADVVLRPFTAADLAKKLRRVVRDRARRT